MTLYQFNSIFKPLDSELYCTSLQSKKNKLLCKDEVQFCSFISTEENKPLQYLLLNQFGKFIRKLEWSPGSEHLLNISPLFMDLQLCFWSL